MITDILKAVSESHSISEVLRKIGRYPNTRNIKDFREYLEKSKINFEHFTKNGQKIQPIIEKICPICGDKFDFQIGKNKKEKTTCSYSCSNTYFARKRNKPERYKNYRTICFKYHGKKCIICGEDRIVEAHHIDENHKNNDPKNLVPLCPTHHQYWHSRYRNLIKEKIEIFAKNVHNSLIFNGI